MVAKTPPKNEVKDSLSQAENTLSTSPIHYNEVFYSLSKMEKFQAFVKFTGIVEIFDQIW